MVTCACGGCPGLAALEAKWAAFEQREIARRLSRNDHERLDKLLPAIVGVFGSTPWLVREVIAHESVGLRLVLGGTSARSLGRLLARGCGVPIDGLVIERVTEEDHALLWSVSQIVPSPRGF